MEKAKAKALRFEEFGKPEEVLNLVEIDVRDPAEGEVVLEMERSALHPSDLGIIGGSYGRLPDLPAIAGREGVGRAIQVGANVPADAVGKRFYLSSGGVWSSRKVASFEDLVEVPEGVPSDQAALAGVNPTTAFLLLENFANLKPGDWVVQNAANSAVGVAVVQLCRSRGIHTANLVRRKELFAPMESIGADVVVLDDREAPEKISAEIGSDPVPLGLNSVGGPSVLNLAKVVSDHGTVVTFGGMTGEKIRFPTRQLIFNDIRFAGFWMDRWNRVHGEGDRKELLGRVFQAIEDGSLKTQVEAVYPLEKCHDALEHNASGRMGKVLFGDV